jgi:GT2 family glycosyltransferase
VPDLRTGIVVITRNRRAALLENLDRLTRLPTSPRVVVVDNGSTDGTVAGVRAHYPEVGVIALGRNLGAAGRTVGVRALTTPFVAFADDDSWWAPESLTAAADLLDADPRLALVAARTVIGADGEREDPVADLMRHSPLAGSRGVGPGVLGFIACGAVLRCSAYLAVGGFHPRFGVGGEETLLAVDLVTAGWSCCFVEHIVAHHDPSPLRDPAARRRREVRNALWTVWLRRPAQDAAVATGAALNAARRDVVLARGVLDAVAGLAWVLRQRRRVPDAVHEAWTAVDAAGPSGRLAVA